MEPRSCNDPFNGALTKGDSASLATWLATLALVLIVILAALSLAAWREHKKNSETVGAQMTTINYNTRVYSACSFLRRALPFVVVGAGLD